MDRIRKACTSNWKSQKQVSITMAAMLEGSLNKDRKKGRGYGYYGITTPDSAQMDVLRQTT